MKTTDPASRIVFLDYLRVAACFMVILVHSIEPFYLGGEGTYIASPSDAFWVTLLDSALRAAVPLFVMTSSYLLFPVKGSTSEFFRRRAVRVLLPFIFWAIMYAVVPMWGSGGETDAAGNLRHLALNFTDNAGHLWFVYMLLGIYILMPVISPWAERLTRRGERIFLAAWAFTTLVPFLHQAAIALFGRAEIWGEANWNEFGTLYYISGFIGYVILGHYIRRYVDWSWRRTLAVAIPLFAAGYAITAAWFWHCIPSEYPVNAPIDLAVEMEMSWRFCSTGVAMTTVALFLIFKKFSRPGRAYPLVERLSRLSYGIYLMHIFVLTAAYDIISQWALATPVTMLLTAAATFVVCAVATRIISLIPKSKYIIG
ncbi:MAG: acyltransferase family protein [Alistipes sp.]|nr:acyltransferase family protein [Alistipes sp.]